MSIRRRRSELSTPASNPKMIESAIASAADLVSLDLEDGVPKELKQAGRRNAIAALRELDWGSKIRAIRVNGLDTRWGFDDVVGVVEAAGDRLDVILVPKPQAPRDYLVFRYFAGAARVQARFEKEDWP